MRILLVLALFGISGCMDGFGQGLLRQEPVSLPPVPKITPASTAAASKVDALGRDILKANPTLPVQPAFLTVGVPEPMLFHRGEREIYISEGMVNACQTDARVAAALCTELGKVIVEQEMLANRARRTIPPVRGGVSSNVDGGLYGADQTELVELARYEKANPRRLTPEVARDPREVATDYLINTGFKSDDLTAIAPLLNQAENNQGIQKQLNRAPMQPAPRSVE